MGVFDQLKRSFLGSLTGDTSGGAPLDPTIPGDTALEAFARDERFAGHLEDATVTGRHTSPCGDRMSFTLRIEDGVIAAIGFEVKGCALTRACASMVAHRVHGRRVTEAIGLSAGDVMAAIPEIPRDHLHPAMLAVTSLYKGLSIWSVRESDDHGSS